MCQTSGVAPPTRPAPVVSQLARAKKLPWFFARLSKDAAILDVGSGDGWVKRWANEHGYRNVTSLDLVPPADVVGDVTRFREIGITAGSFDAVVAFEVVEHGEFAPALHDLLKPSGLLLATTPVPSMDWACRLMEFAGLLQRRTSPHTHLVDLRKLPRFQVVDYRIRAFISQWGVLRPL